jgi:transcriptional regulator with XRE-family HTH domain
MAVATLSTQMHDVRTAAQWMEERKFSVAELVAAAGLDGRIVEAIVQGRYTPSPQQRERLAAALGVGVEQITWDHASPVEHMYGHGPQFGRSP